jgi:hypothetical protein
MLDTNESISSSIVAHGHKRQQKQNEATHPSDSNLVSSYWYLLFISNSNDHYSLIKAGVKKLDKEEERVSVHRCSHPRDRRISCLTEPCVASADIAYSRRLSWWPRG